MILEELKGKISIEDLKNKMIQDAFDESGMQFQLDSRDDQIIGMCLSDFFNRSITSQKTEQTEEEAIDFITNFYQEIHVTLAIKFFSNSTNR